MAWFSEWLAEASGRGEPREATGGRQTREPDGYDRARILPRLVPVDPGLLADPSPEGRRRILQLIARALRGERRRGRAGHWSYSLDRHLGLVSAFKAERRLSRQAEPAGDGSPSGTGPDVREKAGRRRP